MKFKKLFIAFQVLLITFILYSDQKMFEFGKLDSVFKLAFQIQDYEIEGKSIKARKASDKLKSMLDILFEEGRFIEANKSCFFKRQEYAGQNRYFIFDTYLPLGEEYSDVFFNFQIVAESDSVLWCEPTKDSIVEKFEEVDFFMGKIQVAKDRNLGKTYNLINVGGSVHLSVYCKIIDLIPKSKKKVE